MDARLDRAPVRRAFAGRRALPVREFAADGARSNLLACQVGQRQQHGAGHPLRDRVHRAGGSRHRNALLREPLTLGVGAQVHRQLAHGARARMTRSKGPSSSASMRSRTIGRMRSSIGARLLRPPTQGGAPAIAASGPNRLHDARGASDCSASVTARAMDRLRRRHVAERRAGSRRSCSRVRRGRRCGRSSASREALVGPLQQIDCRECPWCRCPAYGLASRKMRDDEILHVLGALAFGNRNARLPERGAGAEAAP